VSGNGPKFVKNPKSVRYRVGDVRDWIAHNTVQSTREPTTRLSRFGDMWDCFDDPVPAIIINNVPMGFFRSLGSTSCGRICLNAELVKLPLVALNTSSRTS
jgi:hypothetical protein